MRTVLIALAVFVSVIFVVAEMRRSAPPSPQDLAQQEYKQVYAEIISKMVVQGAHFMTLFNEDRLDELYESFADPMKQITSFEDLNLMRDARIKQLGEEAEPLSESVKLERQNFVYTRISRFSKYDGEVQIVITMNTSNEIVGFRIQPYHGENEEEES